jgi:hypothetical protein
MTTRTELFRLNGAVERDPGIDGWMKEHAGELGAIAQRWFDVVRECGDEVRELLHDGCPTACLGDAAFGYVNVFTSHVNVGFFQGASLSDPVPIPSPKAGTPFIICMITRPRPMAGFRSLFIRVPGVNQGQVPHPHRQKQARPVEPSPHAIPTSASPGQNTQTPPRKIRDPLLMKNPRPNHAAFDTQHSLKCMCRQTSPTRRPSSDRTKHPSYFAAPLFRGRVSAAAGSSSWLARPSHHLQLFSPLAEVHPSVEIHKPLGVPMTRHMIWAEDENFTGWCCSRCPWGVVAPRLESTVAALAFNRVAQEGFEQHACAQNTRETAPL